MNNVSTNEKIDELYLKIVKKISRQNIRLGETIPYIPRSGNYEDMGKKDICWWTNGFWPGILWQVFNATSDEELALNAEKIERRMDRALEEFDGLHHDVGFMWLLSAIANYRITGNGKSKTRGLHAATILAGRYNPKGKFIRSWNDDKYGWVIVDSMMNLPVLYWASNETGDKRFQYIAMDHADKVMTSVVRADGSCNHIASLDSENGELIETPRGQGYASGSSWSRGQSWAIYGFALSFRHTKKMEYLDTAKNIAHYFLANIANTEFIPKVDFRSPDELRKIDTTAGVCAACGLLEIAEHVGPEEKTFYINGARNIITKVSELYCNWDPEEDAILGQGTAAYHQDHDAHVPIIYGDYYFVEAVFRLSGKHIHLW